MIRKKVVLDTDFGTDADDAVAVALALASDEIEVQAFTVTGRQSIYRKQMLENFLSALGKDFDAPLVYAGWDAPPPLPQGFSLTATGAQPGAASFPGAAFGAYLASLGGAYRFNWFGVEGTLDRNSPTRASGASAASRPTYEAGQQLASLLSKGDTDVVAIGPLTNLYQLLTNPNYNAASVSVPRLTVMGVHLQPTPYGTDPKTGKDEFVSAGVDYNLASDPVSTLYVLNELAKPGFSTGATPALRDARWVTADVTLRTWLDASQLSRLSGGKHPFLRRLVRMIEAWTPIMTKQYGHAESGNTVFLHDPLTLACAFSDEWCNFETLHLELALTNDFGLRWIAREEHAPGTIPMTCAVSLKTPPQTEQTFQEWMVERLLAKFA